MDAIEKSIQLVDDGYIEEALILLENFIKTCSDDEKAIIAQLYMEWGFYEEAKQLFEALLKDYVDNDEIRILLASIYTELEDDERAFQLLDEIDETSDVYIQSLIQSADLYESQGLHEVAEHKLLQAKKLKPQEILIDFALGELFFSIGQFNRALTYYENVLKKESEYMYVNIRERIAECLASLGRFEESFTYYDQIEHQDADSLFKQGLVAFYSDRQEVSVQIWQKLIKDDPYYHLAYVYLGNLFYKEKNYDDALSIVKKGLKIDEFNKELYLLAAKTTYQLNKLEESEQYIKKAIELDDDYKEAILFLVTLYKEQNDYDQIIAFINELKALNIYDPDYEWELARALYETDRFKDARTIYDKLYNEFKGHEAFLKEYGYFLVEEGMINKAIDVFKQYLSFVDDDEIQLYIERLDEENALF